MNATNISYFRTRTKPQLLQESPAPDTRTPLMKRLDDIEGNSKPVLRTEEPRILQDPTYWRKALNDDLRANCKKCRGTGCVWILDSDGDVVPDVCNWCQGGARMGAYPLAGDVVEVGF